MITDIFRKLKTDDTNEKSVVEILNTYFGAGLYSYMIFLNNTDRKSEGELIENLRTKIFIARESFNKDKMTKVELSKVFRNVIELLKTQMVVVKTNPDKVWEWGFVDSYINDLTDYAYLLNPNKE